MRETRLRTDGRVKRRNNDYVVKKIGEIRIEGN